MDFSYLHFKHPNILLLQSNSFLQSITPKASEMKKSVMPWHTGNMENDGISTESRRNRDVFPTNLSSEFCQGDIPSQFRCDSVYSTDFQLSLTEPGFLFLYVLISDVLGVIDSKKKFDRESSSKVCKIREFHFYLLTPLR